MAVSRQAYELDKERIRLETQVRDIEKESSRRVGERVKQEDEIKEFKNVVEELKADTVEKDTHLDHLQKRSDELCSSLGKAKEEAIKEFRASSVFTELSYKNYAAGFDDFCMDAIESFPRVDFDSIKLPTMTESSLLQTSSKDVNIDNDASTPHPMKDNLEFGGIGPSGLSPK